MSRKFESKRGRKKGDINRGNKVNRNDGNINFLEGRNVVFEGLNSGRKIKKIFVDVGALKSGKDGKIAEITELARERGVAIVPTERGELDRISQTDSHQGIIAEAVPRAEISLTGLLKSIRGKKEPFILVLGEVMYEHNLGAIIRTAEGAGVDAIVIPKRRTAPLSPTVARVSMGASEYVPLIRESITSALSILRRERVMIFGVETGGDHQYYDMDMTGSTALVFGGEDRGLTTTIRDRCDEVVSIPLLGKIGSLNVGISVGVVLFERLRQEGLKG